MNPKIDLTGQRFGVLTVIGHSPRKMNGHGTFWVCRCDCGSFVVVRSDNLRKGRTSRCSYCRCHPGGRKSVIVKEVIEDGVV